MPPRVVAPDAPSGPFDPEIIRRATAAYYALINHIDDCIAHVIEQWTGYGSSDAGAPYYVLFSSDHGEMLGDHQLFRKSLGHEASSRVPFFITGANVPLHRASCDELVCWEDIAPTLLDLAGVDIPPHMHGRSLAPLVRGDDGASAASPDARDHLFGQCEGWHHNLWVTTSRWKYLWYPRTGEEQLFDLENDPRELCDLSGESPALNDLRALMATHVEGRGDLDYSPANRRPCANRPPRAFWPE